MNAMMHCSQTPFGKPPARGLPGLSLACLVLALGSGGCWNSNPTGPRTAVFDRVGRTYYIDGAGNWGYGVTDVQEGLRRAGYRGNIINYRWSPTFNPALDQTIGRVAAYARGKELAKEITAYLRRYPANQANIIALSAGTGVGVWACENLAPPAKINNLILLGSSLSAEYDMSKALANISGGVWVYYSPNDQILSGPVRALGTIDGRMIADSAGLVGLHPPHGDKGKIHNIGWSARWERYGWSGSHTDATSQTFVRQVLAKHIVPEQPGTAEGTHEQTAAAHPTPPTSQPATQPALPAVQTVARGS